MCVCQTRRCGCVSGGWSDTPPIAFEHGGSVTNVAVKVDGKRPIGARARRVSEAHLLLVSHTGGREGGASSETVCVSLDDLRDHCQPHAPGRRQRHLNDKDCDQIFSNWPHVCVCYRSPAQGRVRVQRSGVPFLPSSSEASAGAEVGRRVGAAQLVGAAHRIWSGWEHSLSHRQSTCPAVIFKLLCAGHDPICPLTGSSSILAAALLAAVYRCTGRSYDTDSLIHGVLHLEQMLTTGLASLSAWFLLQLLFF